MSWISFIAEIIFWEEVVLLNKSWIFSFTILYCGLFLSNAIFPAFFWSFRIEKRAASFIESCFCSLEMNFSENLISVSTICGLRFGVLASAGNASFALRYLSACRLLISSCFLSSSCLFLSCSSCAFHSLFSSLFSLLSSLSCWISWFSIGFWLFPSGFPWGSILS